MGAAPDLEASSSRIKSIPAIARSGRPKRSRQSARPLSAAPLPSSSPGGRVSTLFIIVVSARGVSHGHLTQQHQYTRTDSGWMRDHVFQDISLQSWTATPSQGYWIVTTPTSDQETTIEDRTLVSHHVLHISSPSLLTDHFHRSRLVDNLESMLSTEPSTID